MPVGDQQSVRIANRRSPLRSRLGRAGPETEEAEGGHEDRERAQERERGQRPVQDRSAEPAGRKKSRRGDGHQRRREDAERDRVGGALDPVHHGRRRRRIHGLTGPRQSRRPRRPSRFSPALLLPRAPTDVSTRAAAVPR